LIQSVLYFVFPGSIDTLTGGYRYNKQIILQLEQMGWQITQISLHDSFPFPTDEAMHDAEQQLSSIPDASQVLVDGLAFGVMPDIAKALQSRVNLIALVHHPLALETGLGISEQASLKQSETQALHFANHVIVTSPTTAEELKDYAVEQTRISVIMPATAKAALATGTHSKNPERGLRLLCVASLTTRKGHKTLFDALATLTDHAWELVCVGSPKHDPAHAQSLQNQIDALGLSSRITLAGEMDQEALNEVYEQADLFVLPSHYEGYGMVLDEAVARGLPIVSTTAGALPETVPDKAGLLVAPGDNQALAEALRELMIEPAKREQLRHGAIKARETLRSWPIAGEEFQQALQVAEKSERGAPRP